MLLTLLAASVAAQTQCAPVRTRTVPQTDTYHGAAIADPYRWLEDADSDSTAAWVAAQNCVTFAYLNGLPERDTIRERLTRLWNYQRFGTPSRVGGLYLWSRNDGLQDQSVLYFARTLTEEPRVMIDPNRLSTDGTVALSAWDVSDDGRWFAYGTSSGGSDWQQLHVRDIATGRDLADTLRWVKFSSPSWTADHRGFFYSRYDRPDSAALRSVNRFQKLYYHRLGTPQEQDRLIYQRTDQAEWGFGGSVTEDGRYLVIGVWLGTDARNRLYFADLGDPRRPRLDAPVVRLIDTLEAEYSFVGNDGPVFYVFTNLGAPRGRLIAIDTRRPGREHWREIIAQERAVLTGAAHIGGRLVANYLEDAHARLTVFETDGRRVGEVPLPGIGAVDTLSGRADSPEMFYRYTSFLYPTTIFRHDLRAGTGDVWRRPQLPDFDPSRYETRQVFYPSRDGTRVPMFLTMRRGMRQDSTNPVYLTAYGGFNISILPSFSISNLAWLERGGIVAVPSLRGGGEYGEEWHRAGMLERKQNVFDDFIGAAEYLVREGWTRPSRLAIAGGSNGGLLIGAVLNQRPELFGAALPAVGVMDMLRFHRFTIGWAWVTEYGSADSTHQFPFLRAYSPLHNIRPGGRYPAVMVTTADHDDRVVPAHSFKYAAALQAAQAGPAPILIRVDVRAGHGAGKPISKVIEEQADRWAFLIDNLGMRRGGAVP